jgi:hypothetical protein
MDGLSRALACGSKGWLAAAAATAARVLEGDASGDGWGKRGLRLGGSLTRGGLYEVVTAAAEWVTEQWASTSGGGDRAAPRRGHGRL